MPNQHIHAKLVYGPQGMGEPLCQPHSLLAAATTNSTLVKAGRGALTFIVAINVNAAVRYIKFYDTSTAPTAGTGTPVLRFAIPASATGAGFTIEFPAPISFASGIGYTIVTGVADTDATAPSANDVILSLGYV